MNTKRIFNMIAAIFVVSQVSVCHAEGFREKHPRRAQVNSRHRRQEARISRGVKRGTLTQEQGDQLKNDEMAIKLEERADANANGGYLTPAQRRQINQEQKAESQKIYSEKHPQPVSSDSAVISNAAQ